MNTIRPAPAIGQDADRQAEDRADSTAMAVSQANWTALSCSSALMGTPSTPEHQPHSEQQSEGDGRQDEHPVRKASPLTGADVGAFM